MYAKPSQMPGCAEANFKKFVYLQWKIKNLK